MIQRIIAVIMQPLITIEVMTIKRVKMIFGVVVVLVLLVDKPYLQSLIHWRTFMSWNVERVKAFDHFHIDICVVMMPLD